MVRSVLYLPVREGMADAVIALYRRLSILETALRQDGCLASELQVPSTPGAPLLVTATWRDRAAYDGWIANPARSQGTDELAALLEGEFGETTRGETYELVLAVGAGAE